MNGKIINILKEIMIAPINKGILKVKSIFQNPKNKNQEQNGDHIRKQKTKIKTTKQKDLKYLGTITIELNDEELAKLYEGTSSISGIENQYLIVKNNESLVGPFKYSKGTWKTVPFTTFTSRHFGEIKPKNKDPYQMAYMDSLVNNQLTFCTGPAGSGKSQIALAYAFQELEKGNFDRIVIFTNPYIASGAVKLGFLPGTKEEKLLETSIGSILISKLGGKYEVQRLLDSEDLILMPMGDCRGYEVPEKTFVYFTEAQNTSTYLMKLFLQRTNDECKICVEGDIKQTDAEIFNGSDNGLSRAVKIFRGQNYAAHIELRNIYRGKIAKRAELICD